MSIQVPDSAKTAFEDNMQTSGAVELPFLAPPFYIVNGNARLEQVGGIHFYGGWACNVDKLQTAAESWNDRLFPIPGLTATETILDSGQKLQVHASRNIFVAPIGIRQFSTITAPDGRKQRVAPFTKGARPGIQVLCVLGYRDPNKAIQPWAPIMLTASGYQVNHVGDAFANWNKAIKPLVRKLVPGVEPSSILNLFWMSIGTFGKDRKTRTVGGGQQQQIITPVTSYIPDTLDEESLSSLYVGEEIAEWMVELSNLSKDWLQVFKNLTTPKVEQVDSHELDMQEPPPPEDDIPF